MALHNSRRAAVAAGVALLTALAAVAVSGPAVAKDTTGDITYTVNPVTKLFSSTVPAAFPYTPSQCVAKYGLACYTPSLIKKAYGVPADYTGAGTSIAIVDAYGSPTLESDLAAFDELFGLPPADLHVYYPGGTPKTQTAHAGVPSGWAGEVSLDVEWAHAIAPEATINLVVAASPYGNVINNAVQYVVDHHLGDVLSMSYGSDEAALHGNNLQINQAHQIFVAAAAAGISAFASAGDGGATDGYPVANAGYPASDPMVTSVGGTNLFTADDGTYQSESVWNDGGPGLCPFGCTDGVFGSTGGAPSTVFAAPSYQSTVSGLQARSTADVAYNASVYTAVMVVFDGGLYFFGGTSSGSPQWAAIAALATQAAGHPLGQLNATLYATAAAHPEAFHDVTVGNNAFQGPGFPAKVGYDLPTGLGSPDVAALIPLLG